MTKQFLLVKVPALNDVLIVSEEWVLGKVLMLPKSYSCADVRGHAEVDEGSTSYKFNLLAQFNDFEQAVTLKTFIEGSQTRNMDSSSEDTEPASQGRVNR
ncbi:unnamed protein product [Trichobilharzia szidati]|nr:unnamed protein product [Trichobilharzia szidati]